MNGSHSMLRTPAVIAAVLILVCVLFVPVAARGAESSSFSLESQLTGGGGQSASISFTLESCLALNGAGSSASSSYSMQIGPCTALFAGFAADDDDGDGVPNEVEDGVNAGGDGNGDGTADRLQGDVASFPGNSGYVTVISAGAQCNQISSVSSLDESSLDDDGDFHYPLGLVQVALACGSPGQSADIQVLYHGAGAWPLGGYRAFGPIPPAFGGPSIWFSLPGVVFDLWMSTPRASFSISDGALGDNTAVDGIITNIAGPATAIPPIPVLQPEALIVLMILLALVGLMAINLHGRSI